MNRDSLIKEIAAKVGASPLIVRAVMDGFESVVIETVGSGKQVKLAKFGIFEGLETAERRIALFGSKRMATVPARMALRFRESRITGRRLRSAALAKRRG